jgi:hypothetical protein
MNPLKNLRILTAGVVTVLCSAPLSASVVIVSESFTGTGVLHATAADSFSAAVAASGGSGVWAAGSAFSKDGTVAAVDGNSSAYLNLGSYINDSKGTAQGWYRLSASISATTGAWISVGFSVQNTPSTERNFTNTPAGTPRSDGAATMIRRSVTANPANEVDAFRLNDAGTGQTQLDGPDGLLGTRVLTIELDLTPAGGYNGVNNFGTARFHDVGFNPTVPFLAYTYTSNVSFGAIFLSEADQATGPESGGTISALTLVQVPEPSGAALVAVALALMPRRRR